MVCTISLKVGAAEPFGMDAGGLSIESRIGTYQTSSVAPRAPRV